MYQPDLQNGLLHASKMAEALVRLQQQGAECVLPPADLNRPAADDGRRLGSYDHQAPSCVDFSHTRQMAQPLSVPASACGGFDGGNQQSLFVVIARSEYDTMRQELAGLKQSLCELKSTVDQEIRQLKVESRMIKQQLGTCTCRHLVDDNCGDRSTICQ